MKAGRKRVRVNLVPFAAREPQESYSTTTIRISRCNLCGAIRVWPYTEFVLKEGAIVEQVEHPGFPATHEPGCPQAEQEQP